MSCLLNTGYSVPCKSIGGLKELYIGEMSSSVVYGYDAYNQIDSITNIQNYYLLELEKETASFTQVGGFSNENGTAFYTKTLEFTMHGLKQSLIELISVLGKGRWSIVFQDQANQYWLLEPKNITNVIASTPGLGKAYGDLNGCVITMETKGPKPATIITDGFILNGLYIDYQDTPEGGSDTYTPGTYVKTLQFLSTDGDLYLDEALSIPYTLPSSVNGTVTITIGTIVDAEEPQPITISVTNITNNYGVGTFYYILSGTTGIPIVTDNSDSVIFKSY